MPFYGNVLCIVESGCAEDSSLNDDDSDEEYLGDFGEETGEKDAGEEDLETEEDFEHENELNKYYNLNSADFRKIADYFSIASPTVQPIIAIGFPEEWKNRARKLQGVRVHCVGDEALQYTVISYPQDHPFPETMKVPSSFGCGLLFYEVSTKSNASDSDIPIINTNAYNTLKVIKPEELRESKTIKRVDFHVARKNGKDLLPPQLEAICTFLRRDLEKSCMAHTDGTREQYDRMDHIDSSTWTSFWQDFKAMKGWGDEVENPASWSRMGYEEMVGNSKS